jgi:hypothetical protein
MQQPTGYPPPWPPPPDRRSGRLGRGIGITLLAILGAFCGGMAGTAFILVMSLVRVLGDEAP